MLPEVDFRYRLPVYRSFITKTFPACSCWETTAIYHFNRCLVGEVINFSECGFSDLYVEILVEIRCFVNCIKICFLSKICFCQNDSFLLNRKLCLKIPFGMNFV